MIIGLLFGSVLSLNAQINHSEVEIKEHYGREAITVVRLLNMYHYKRMAFGDSLSAIVLENFLLSLDNNKMYFLQKDIDRFKANYASTLDDKTISGDVAPAFDIYGVFMERLKERIEYVYNDLLTRDYDFTIDEYFELEREDLPWPVDENEMNDVWRKSIKSQVLRLKLAEKEPSEIMEIIKKRYDRLKKNIETYRSDDVFQLYMNAISETYDPHTNYFSPASSEKFKQSMSLSLEGIGARLVTDGDYTKVVEVIPGGPAFKSQQIQPDDLIVGVAQGKDGEMEDVIGWRIDDVVNLIKGPRETFVRLNLLKAETGLKGQPVELILQREKIKLQDMAATKTIYHIKRGSNTYQMGVITIPSFYMDFEAFNNGDEDYTSTTRDVKRLIMELKAENIDGLLIDLRNNGGGSLKEAIDLTGLFINEGPVVQIRSSVNKIEIGKDEEEGVLYDGPLTVLINRFSASASEIFSGAIQDYKRGVVVGEQSYGKGTVQSMIQLNRFLPNEETKLGELKLTFQKFYRVTGSSTQHMGVSPDINLPSAFSAGEFGESSQPAALPWDEIKGTKIKLAEKVDGKLITQLNTDYEERLKADPVLQELREEIEELKKTISNNRISLNEETRKKEAEEELKKKAASLKLSGTLQEEVEPDEKLLLKDKYLREGVIILAEIVDLSIG